MKNSFILKWSKLKTIALICVSNIHSCSYNSKFIIVYIIVNLLCKKMYNIKHEVFSDYDCIKQAYRSELKQPED